MQRVTRRFCGNKLLKAKHIAGARIRVDTHHEEARREVKRRPGPPQVTNKQGLAKDNDN